jgi:hypothetical protein
MAQTFLARPRHGVCTRLLSIVRGRAYLPDKQFCSSDVLHCIVTVCMLRYAEPRQIGVRVFISVYRLSINLIVPSVT